MNDENNTPDPVTRRTSIRRGRGAFSGGSSTRSESLRQPVERMEADEVDDAIEPERIHNRIVDAAARRPVLRPATPAIGYRGPQEPDAPAAPAAPSPRDRMEQVAASGSAAYAKEYRLTMLGRLLMRRIPLDQIAAQLGVSVSTIEKDRVEWKARLRATARELDINEIVGNQTEFYGEVTGMALRLASDERTPAAMRLAASRTALASEADRTRFLNSAGVLDVLRYRKAEEGTGVSDVQRLMEGTENMLARLLASDEPAPRPRRAARPAPPRNGFAPLSMDDAHASSSDAETVEL